MRSHAKRLTLPATWARGIRKLIRRTRPRREDEDLRVFREMSQISRRVTADEIDELFGPA